jgi:hypothetical protein
VIGILVPIEIDQLSELIIIKVTSCVLYIGFIFNSGIVNAALINLPHIYLLFDTVGRNKPVDDYVLSLPYPIDPIYALVIVGWIPIRIRNDGPVGSGKVETDP